MGSLFAPGGGAVGEGKIGGEKEVLDQAGGEFSKVDVPYPHTLHLFQRVVPEPLERLTRVEGTVAQGVEFGVQQPVF